MYYYIQTFVSLLLYCGAYAYMLLRWGLQKYFHAITLDKFQS